MPRSDQPKTANRPSLSELSWFSKLIATGFFSGYIPWASGTFGSLVGLAIYWIPGAAGIRTLSALIVIGFILGVVTSSKVANAVGNQLTNSARLAKEIFQPGPHDVPDPSIVVIDEIVGMWISIFLLPQSLLISVLSLLLFRVFDIIKLAPARQLERIPNGWGIMLDDVAAGLYANLLVRGIIFFFPHLV